MPPLLLAFLLGGGYAAAKALTSEIPPGPPPSSKTPPKPHTNPVDGIALVQSMPPFGYPSGSAIDVGSAKIGPAPPAGQPDTRETLDSFAVSQWSQGAAPVTWVPIRCTRANEPKLIVWVSEDAFSIGNVRRVRWTLSRPGSARLCRNLDAVLPTPRIADAIYGQAKIRFPVRSWNAGSGPPAWDATPPPIPRPAATSSLRNNPGTGRDLMLNESIYFESLRGGRSGLCANAGKLVVVSSKLLRDEQSKGQSLVAIYGPHSDATPPAPTPTNIGPWAPMDSVLAAPGISVVQPGNGAHIAIFADYSSKTQLVYRWAELEGKAVDLVDLYADTKLNHLVHVWGGPWGNAVPLPPY